jgi:hypothetical protein
VITIICAKSTDEHTRYDNTEWILTIYDVGEAYSVGGQQKKVKLRTGKRERV